MRGPVRTIQQRTNGCAMKLVSWVLDQRTNKQQRLQLSIFSKNPKNQDRQLRFHTLHVHPPFAPPGFAALKDVTQVRQFIGCTNWVRRYLRPQYATAAEVLGEYMKPKAELPPEGLGSGKSEGCKAVEVIKLLCKHAIQLSTLDEASAIDGSRPL